MTKTKNYTGRNCPACGLILRRDGKCHSGRCQRATPAEIAFHRAVVLADDDEDSRVMLDRHIAIEKQRIRSAKGDTVRA